MKVFNVKICGIQEIKTKDNKVYYIHYFESGKANVYGNKYDQIFADKKYSGDINVAFTGKRYEIVEI